MTEYRRPTFPAEIYRDEQGHPIDYGRRWGGSPPADAYSRVSNLHRFAPLHTVALALIDWVQSSLDVTVEHAPNVAADLLLLPTDVVRAVRVVPRDPAAAPLTFVLSGFPGVYLHAGALHNFHFPVCGCDACDDDVANLADELEWTVRTVVSGGYSERLDPGQGVEYRLEEPGVGTSSGHRLPEELPAGRLERARTALPPTGRWSPWPERGAGGMSPTDSL